MRPLTFLASICVIVGLILLERRRRMGWLFQLTGSVLSIVHFSFVVFDPSVIAMHMFLVGVAIDSWLHWRGGRP